MHATIQKTQEQSEEGFTLIELLVVILIIGILTAIAIPAFLNQRKAAVDASIQSDIRGLALTVETAVNSNGSYQNLTLNGLKTQWNAKFSEGAVPAYKGTSQGFCIQIYNPGGTRTASNPMAYDSSAGGFLKAGTTPVICPANVLTTPMV